MAIQACFCPVTRNNLGTLSCTRVMTTIKKHIFVSVFDATGVRNSIKTTDLVGGILPDAFILDKVNESDPSKRWYFTPDKYENVTGSRTDPTEEEFPSGRKEKIQDGVPEFEGFLIGQDSTLASKIASNGCGDTAVFEVSLSGDIRGELSTDGLDLYPMLINKGSLISVPVPEVEGTSVSKIQLNFQFDQTIKEGRLQMLQANNIATDLLKVNGLIDGTTTILSSPTVTSTTFSTTVNYSSYGAFGVQNQVQGLDVVGDWELLDGVTPVTISGIVDLNGDGTQYDFTFTLTAATLLTLNYIGVPAASTDQGFDISSDTVTTP